MRTRRENIEMRAQKHKNVKVKILIRGFYGAFPRYRVVSGNTHRSEELLHVRRICVDDQLEDLLVPDFAQNLPVGSRTRLTDVHFGPHGWRGFHEILQSE